ncbi:hypothetical protein E3N88_06872 [Mikania micrantha]|uniref:Uncharacterized protein n=1 Tax=Mikania micrantha TaxID=192012 RepID=A0A5N6PR85_9ASTR|nr:hypothetical protein E3N88_06872 [Mikania micrantha]
MYVGTHTRPNSKGEQPCYLSTEETAVDFRVRVRPSYMYLTIDYVIAERLVFQSLYLWELVSAYMRYVKAKHKRNVTELLPGYKGHVIAERLVFQSFCPLIRGLVPYICPIYKHTDLDITGGVNEVKVLRKEVKNRFNLKLLGYAY